MIAAKKIPVTEERAPEYDVYIFHSKRQPSGTDWERRHTTPCVKDAHLHAQELMQTNAYPKVEIHKKYFDARRECKVDCAVKTYGQKPDTINWKVMAIIVTIMIASAIVILKF